MAGDVAAVLAPLWLFFLIGTFAGVVAVVAAGAARKRRMVVSRLDRNRALRTVRLPAPGERTHIPTVGMAHHRPIRPAIPLTPYRRTLGIAGLGLMAGKSPVRSAWPDHTARPLDRRQRERFRQGDHTLTERTQQ